MGVDKKVRRRIISKESDGKKEKKAVTPKSTTSNSCKKVLLLIVALFVMGLAATYLQIIPSPTALFKKVNIEVKSLENQKEQAEALAKEINKVLTDGSTQEKPKPQKPNSEKQKKEKSKKEKEELKLLGEEDMKIWDEIKRGDKLTGTKKVKEAISHFEKLLKHHPQSARAKFGLGMALIGKAEKERSNQILVSAIETLKEVTIMPTANEALKREAYLTSTRKYNFLGRYRDCLSLFAKMMKQFPNDVDIMNEYGVVLLSIGKNQRAKPIYQEVLKLDENNAFAQVHLAFILKAEGEWEQATSLFATGLASNAPGTQDGRFYFHFGDALYRTGRREEAGEWYQRGADKGLFRSKYQRSLYNVDRLKSRPFWTAKQAKVSDIVKKLESNWKTIRDEALNVMNVEEGLFLHEEESLKNTGEWRQFTLFSKGKKHGDCSRTPKTCALVSKMTQAASCRRGQIKYSIMMPGTHVWPHTGPTNVRLRMHLGLVVPKSGNGTKLRCADEYRTWEEGKVMIFDDSFEHEVWQEADSYRLILIIDVWHPDLTDRERNTLTAM